MRLPGLLRVLVGVQTVRPENTCVLSGLAPAGSVAIEWHVWRAAGVRRDEGAAPSQNTADPNNWSDILIVSAACHLL